MLLLFLLLDLPVQILLLSPAILWFTAAGHWHPWIIAYGTCSWGGLATVFWSRFARAESEERKAARPQGNWRWPAGMHSETYVRRLSLLLHNHGWRDLKTLSLEPSAVTLLMQKDRTRLVVRCHRGRLNAPDAEIAALANLRTVHQAQAACLMLDARSPGLLVATAGERGVHLLRFSDIRFLDSPTGPLALALGDR